MYSKRLSTFDGLANGVTTIAAGTVTAVNPTNHAVQVGDGTTLTSITAATTGQLLIGATSANPAFGSSINGDITLTSSTNGATRTFLVDHTSSANSSSAVIQARVGGALSADPRMLLSVQGSNDWCMKNNNVGSHEWVLANSALGTTNQFLIVDNAGCVTKPSDVSVVVYNNLGASNVTGDNTSATLVLDVEITDANGNFSSNTFTAPVTGRYEFYWGISLTGITASHTATFFQLITSNRNWLTNAFNLANARDSNNNCFVTSSLTVDMDANDTATININVLNGTKVVGYQGLSASAPRTYLGVTKA